MTDERFNYLFTKHQRDNYSLSVIEHQELINELIKQLEDKKAELISAKIDESRLAELETWLSQIPKW